jgi:uncharacterized protein YmfQ (DUF2313 family)
MSWEPYKQALLKLLPQGLAWNKDADSNLNKLIEGESIELGRLEDFAYQTLREINPLTTNQLLNEWVEIALGDGLCTGVGQTPSELKAALLARLISLGGSSKTYFQEVARAAGFLVSINDGYSLFRAGLSRSGDRVLSSGFAYTWSVRTGTQTLRYLRAGSGRAGDPLVYFGNLLLECLLRGIKPAHTQIIFSYLDVIINLSANLNINVATSGFVSIRQKCSANLNPSITAELLDPWSPEFLSKLLLWYDATDFTSNAAVSTWTDKKGNRNAIQGNVSKQPSSVINSINNKPVVEFSTGDELEVLHLNDFDLNRGLHFCTIGDVTAGGGLLFNRNQLEINTSTTNNNVKALTSTFRPNNQGAAPPSNGVNFGVVYHSGSYYSISQTHVARQNPDGTWTTIHTGPFFGSHLISQGGNLFWLGINSIFKYDGTTVTEYANTVNVSANLYDFIFRTADSLFYVHDGSNQKLLSFNPVTNVWVQRATSTSSIAGRALATDGTDIYIRQATQIYKWDGTTLTSEGLSGVTGIECIHWANGTLWVWASEKLTNKANSYTLISVPTRISMLGRAMTVDNGYLYIYDNFNGWLVRYLLSGTSLAGSFDNWDTGALGPQNTMIVGTAIGGAFITNLPDDVGVMVHGGGFLKRIERIRYLANTATVPALSIFAFSIFNNKIDIAINGETVQSATFPAETYRNPKQLLQQIAITNGALVTFLANVITINPTSDLPLNAKIEVGIDSGAVTTWDGFFDDWIFTTEIS